MISKRRRLQCPISIDRWISIKSCYVLSASCHEIMVTIERTRRYWDPYTCVCVWKINSMGVSYRRLLVIRK